MTINFKDVYATVWDLDPFENHTVVRLSTSRKDRENEGKYINSNWGFVRFVGKAHKAAPELDKGTRIKILSGLVSNEQYEKDGEKHYPKNPQIVVFEYELSDKKSGNKSSSKSNFDSPPMVDDDVPF